MDNDKQAKIDQQMADLELEEQLTNDVKKKVSEMFGKVVESASELAWTMANDYINKYLETDTYVNCRDTIRNEVSWDAYRRTREPKDSWGKEIREAIFQDHKEEILALIKDDQIEKLQREARMWRELLDRRY